METMPTTIEEYDTWLAANFSWRDDIYEPHRYSHCTRTVAQSIKDKLIDCEDFAILNQFILNFLGYRNTHLVALYSSKVRGVGHGILAAELDDGWDIYSNNLHYKYKKHTRSAAIWQFTAEVQFLSYQFDTIAYFSRDGKDGALPPAQLPLMYDYYCPFCFNKIGTWYNDSIPFSNSELKAQKLLLPSYFKYLTTERMNQIKAFDLIDLQNRCVWWEEFYIEPENRTNFSLINSNYRLRPRTNVRAITQLFQIKTKYITELRTSIEKLISVLGMSKLVYFNHDDYGRYIQKNESPDYDQLDWKYLNLDNGYNHVTAFPVEDLRRNLRNYKYDFSFSGVDYSMENYTEMEFYVEPEFGNSPPEDYPKYYYLGLASDKTSAPTYSYEGVNFNFSVEYPENSFVVDNKVYYFPSLTNWNPQLAVQRDGTNHFYWTSGLNISTIKYPYYVFDLVTRQQTTEVIYNITGFSDIIPPSYSQYVPIGTQSSELTIVPSIIQLSPNFLVTLTINRTIGWVGSNPYSIETLTRQFSVSYVDNQ